jgi:hypothetical protein
MSQRNIGYNLPSPPQPLALYEAAGSARSLINTYGMTARDQKFRGLLGEDITTPVGKEAAVRSALNFLAVLQEYLGFSKIGHRWEK